jgi:ethanolamine utilization microcompartment shell protein EutS
MKPEPGRVLQGVGVSLLTAVLPEVATPFGQQTTSSAGALALMISEEFDRAPERLSRENAAVRAILADARGVTPDQAAAIDQALAVKAADLRVSTLQKENDALRAALIGVHAAVEAIDTAEAKALNERIWAELVESTKRRAFATRLG